MSSVHEHLACELLLTGTCNLDCSYCIARDVPQVVMTEEVGHAAIDLFVYLAQGARSIDYIFSGGEPLVALPILKKCTEYANNKTEASGMRPAFVLKTNGTLLNAEAITFLKDWNFKVVLSIDGIPSVHNKHRVDKHGCPTHKRILDNLEALQQNGIQCTASITVHPDTVSSLENGVRYLHAKGFTEIDIGPVYGTVQWTKENIAELVSALHEIAKYLREVHARGQTLEVTPINQTSQHVDGFLADTWGCGAISTNLAFLPNGKIAGCSALAMISERFPELVLGNVKDGLQQDAVDHVLQFVQAPLAARPTCQQCDHGHNCAGGCLAINFASTAVPIRPPDLYCSTMGAIPEAWRLAWGSN